METIRPKDFSLSDWILAAESLRNKTVEVTKITDQVIIGEIIDIGSYGLIYINGQKINPRVIKSIRPL